MGLMDKLKGLLKGRETQVKQGIDTASDQIEKRVGPKHAAKVDDMSDKVKDQVDKLAGDRPDSPTATTATAPASDRPVAPPPSTSTPPSAGTPGAPPPEAPPI